MSNRGLRVLGFLRRLRAPLLALIALMVLAGAARADEDELFYDLRLGGGSVVRWADIGQVGNAFGGGLGIGWQGFRAGVSVAGVFPDSLVRGSFEAFWAEVSWAPRGMIDFYHVMPYAVLGLGLAIADGADVSANESRPPVRWVATGPEFLAMLGVGAEYGGDTGLFVDLDMRLYNHTHGGVNVGVGYRF